jgi:hypothetical protein
MKLFVSSASQAFLIRLKNYILRRFSKRVHNVIKMSWHNLDELMLFGDLPWLYPAIPKGPNFFQQSEPELYWHESPGWQASFS